MIIILAELALLGSILRLTVLQTMVLAMTNNKIIIIITCPIIISLITNAYLLSTVIRSNMV
jgi:hypothetical protein